MTLAAALLLAAALAQTPEKPTPAAPEKPTPTAPAAGEQQSAAPAAPQSPREKALAQAADQAKKDVDFAAIGLHAAKLYLTGLYGLDGRPSTWDREHGVALFTHAQDALADVQRQVAELQGFAHTTWPDSRAPLTRVRKTLDGVEKQLRSLSVPLHPSAAAPDAGQSAIKDMYDALDSAQGDLDKAAKAMGVDAKLKKP
ncbi:MAG TPA: hypothetical protein VE620_04190 [Myxococcales bacterium]|jgi:hypothetical protein|nr:hypothetical protein [Myxococcales bacterium]